MYLPRQAQLPAAHKVHADKTKLTCIDCHTNATTSGSANDWLGPPKERCIECHGQKFEGVVMAPPPSPRIRLSHAKHASKGIECAVCHGRVSGHDDAARRRAITADGDVPEDATAEPKASSAQSRGAIAGCVTWVVVA